MSRQAASRHGGQIATAGDLLREPVFELAVRPHATIRRIVYLDDTRLSTALNVLLCLIGVSCSIACQHLSVDESGWREVQKEDTLQGYIDHLKAYGNCPHAPVARRELESRLYDRCLDLNQRSEDTIYCQAYLELVPNGARLKAVRNRLVTVLWDVARDQGTPKALQAVIENSSADDPRKQEAEARLAKLARLDVEAKSRIEAEEARYKPLRGLENAQSERRRKLEFSESVHLQWPFGERLRIYNQSESTNPDWYKILLPGDTMEFCLPSPQDPFSDYGHRLPCGHYKVYQGTDFLVPFGRIDYSPAPSVLHDRYEGSCSIQGGDPNDSVSIEISKVAQPGQLYLFEGNYTFSCQLEKEFREFIGNSYTTSVAPKREFKVASRMITKIAMESKSTEFITEVSMHP